MEINDISELETLKIINSMSSSTAHEDDGLDILSVKMAVGGLYRQITSLINMSIRSGKYVNKWKNWREKKFVSTKEQRTGLSGPKVAQTSDKDVH